MEGKFVSYLRVSTQKLGQSGLGLEAQKAAVATFLKGGIWKLLGEFVEVESGKADHNRPKLAEALALCRMTGATLLIAKSIASAATLTSYSACRKPGCGSSQPTTRTRTT
jgi:DNA invertase Pin-like site-specific DNA recombinase